MKKFKVFTDISPIIGSSKRGMINCSGSILRKLFGTPIKTPNGSISKIKAEWRLKFDDGMIVTVYIWTMKTGRIAYTKHNKWTIGGFSDYEDRYSTISNESKRIGDIVGNDKIISCPYY